VKDCGSSDIDEDGSKAEDKEEIGFAAAEFEEVADDRCVISAFKLVWAEVGGVGVFIYAFFFGVWTDDCVGGVSRFCFPCHLSRYVRALLRWI
jgi:hypothetical protein